MKIVIEIPEDYYKVINEIPVEQSTADMLIIRNGIPLPKGHGRLIDADELERTMKKDKRKALSFVDLTDFVWLAQTIIEAEKEE